MGWIDIIKHLSICLLAGVSIKLCNFKWIFSERIFFLLIFLERQELNPGLLVEKGKPYLCTIPQRTQQHLIQTISGYHSYPLLNWRLLKSWSHHLKIIIWINNDYEWDLQTVESGHSHFNSQTDRSLVTQLEKSNSASRVQEIRTPDGVLRLRPAAKVETYLDEYTLVCRVVTWVNSLNNSHLADLVSCCKAKKLEFNQNPLSHFVWY